MNDLPPLSDSDFVPWTDADRAADYGYMLGYPDRPSIDRLADEIDAYYETDSNLHDLYETTHECFSNGDTIDFEYFAYISIRDLRDADDPADDLYTRYLDLNPAELQGLLFALATRFYAHLMGA